MEFKTSHSIHRTLAQSNLIAAAILLKLYSRLVSRKSHPPLLTPVQVYGRNNLRQHQRHILDSMISIRDVQRVGTSSNFLQTGALKPTSTWLTRGLQYQKENRSFLEKSVCGKKTDRPVGRNYCDEYPYNSTLQGGNTAYYDGNVSTRLVTQKESNAQGGNISTFYDKNNLISFPFHLDINDFVVLPIGSTSGYYDRRWKWKKVPKK